MDYSWPKPLPPDRRGTIRLIRCARCDGPLHHTKTRGQPRQEDHELGCEAFIRAIRVMRYVDELKRSASEPASAWGRSRWRRKYLRESAKKLTVAACESDPVAAITALGDLYQADGQAQGKRATLEKTEMAETLMLACRQLAQGQDPAPITPRM